MRMSGAFTVVSGGAQYAVGSCGLKSELHIEIQESQNKRSLRKEMLLGENAQGDKGSSLRMGF